MAQSRVTQFAEALKADKGALLTVTDIADFLGQSRQYVYRAYLPKLNPVGRGNGKRYVYFEVAEAVLSGRCQ